MTEKTFSELYCEQRGIAPERYENAALCETLYPHARLLRSFLQWFNPRYFAADMDLIRSVAHLRRYREYSFAATEFSHHPANRGFARLTLHLRISSRALRHLVRVTLHPDTEAGRVGGARRPVDQAPRATNSATGDAEKAIA